MRELSFADFQTLAKAGGCVRVWRDIPPGGVTALDAFARLRSGQFDALLESAGTQPAAWTRYSYVSSGALRGWRLLDGVVEDWSPHQGWYNDRTPHDPLTDLAEMLSELAPAAGADAVWSGAVGYVGYDVVRHLERLPAPPPRDTAIPDVMFVIPRVTLTFDSSRTEVRAAVAAEPQRGADGRALRHAFDAAHAEIEATLARLQSTHPAVPRVELDPRLPPAVGHSSRARDGFMADVDTAREYIRAGDAFQIVLTRRIELEHDFDSSVLYRALRAINPSPYMYHLAFGGVELVGSSPELFVRVEDSRVTVRPIAGTRPRPRDPAADERVAEELRNDPKEQAEHVMLVDLGRNDIGRVARFGTVKVDKLMEVERYSHVLHLVSDVSGTLNEGCNAIDALRATFPTGTMTGAPKVRAMEIIDELEPVRRGPYAGAVGLIGPGAREANLAVTIRTCVLAGGRAFVQAGAGIVTDSIPEREWEESERKAEAVLVAIAHARARGAQGGA